MWERHAMPERAAPYSQWSKRLRVAPIAGLRLIVVAAAICTFGLWTSTARADVLVQAHSDLEGLATCSLSGGSSGSCSVVDAASTANLATGVLGVQANCCDYNAHNDPSSGEASATAKFTDTVTLVLPNGYTASTIPFVTFDLTLSGASEGISAPTLDAAHPSATIKDFLQVTPGSGGISGCQSTDPTDDCGGPNSPLNLSITFTNISTSDLNFTLTALLQATATGFDPFAGATVTGSGFADALDPGQLSIDLPQGFGFTSGSGVLLTQAATVPEPSTLMLLGSGLVTIVFVRRRRSDRKGQDDCKAVPVET